MTMEPDFFLGSIIQMFNHWNSPIFKLFAIRVNISRLRTAVLLQHPAKTCFIIHQQCQCTDSSFSKYLEIGFGYSRKSFFPVYWADQLTGRLSSVA